MHVRVIIFALTPTKYMTFSPVFGESLIDMRSKPLLNIPIVVPHCNRHLQNQILLLLKNGGAQGTLHSVNQIKGRPNSPVFHVPGYDTEHLIDVFMSMSYM
jgi:hypothetical protein